MGCGNEADVQRHSKKVGSATGLSAPYQCCPGTHHSSNGDGLASGTAVASCRRRGNFCLEIRKRGDGIAELAG